jgi:hypothetical protein
LIHAFGVTIEELESLPGTEIVLPGIDDLENGRRSVNASAAHELYPH